MKQTVKAKEPVRIRTKQLKDGNRSIYLDIYYKGKRHYQFLKLYLVPERSREDKRRNRETCRLANAIKAQRIVEMQNDAYGFKPHRFSRLTLTEYLGQIIRERNGQKRRNAALEALAGHIERYSPKGIQLQNVDRDYLLGFLEHLRSTKQKHCRKEKHLHENTILHYFKLLSRCLNRAVEEGLVSENPTVRIKKDEQPKHRHSEREYLTISEVRRLTRTPFHNPLLAKAFLFSCFCGLRHCDVVALKWNDIHCDDDGNASLSIVQRKTRTPLSLPLSREALNQLPERNGETPDSSPVFQGLITLGRSNEILHRWAAAAGIGKHITFHTARHTYATMLLTLGADLYTVSKLLGHSNIQTTQIYARLVDERKRKAVELIPPMS